MTNISDNSEIVINTDENIEEQLEAQKDKITPFVENIKNNAHILQGLTEEEIVKVIVQNKSKREKIIQDIFNLKIFKKLIEDKLNEFEKEFTLKIMLKISRGEYKFSDDEKETIKKRLFLKVNEKEINIIKHLFDLRDDLNKKINEKTSTANIHGDLTNYAIAEYEKNQSSLDDFKKGDNINGKI